mgnify:CR=1 FL=1
MAQAILPGLTPLPLKPCTLLPDAAGALPCVLVIVLEIVASLMILSGRLRWLGALALAAFTLGATFMANRFWEMVPPERFGATNSFFEHLGLIGGFLLVAWHDLQPRERS